MSIALSTVTRALVILLICTIYIKYYGSLSTSVDHTSTATTGLHKLHFLDSYDTDADNLSNFVQIYVAFEITFLFVWPFWSLYSQRIRPVRFVWDCVTHWVAAVVIFLGVTALKEFSIHQPTVDMAL